MDNDDTGVAELTIVPDTARWDDAVRRVHSGPVIGRGGVALEMDKLHRGIERANQEMSVMFAGFRAAFIAIAQVMVRAKVVPPTIPRHGFTPSFDLVCTVCGLGPEECRGG